MRTLLALAAFIALPGLTSCGEAESTKGGLSAEEERRLQNIAERLDEGMGNPSFDAAPDNEAAGNGSAGR